MFEVQTILVLDFKKRNDREIFHSSAKVYASHSDIDEAFESKHQRIMTKMKNYAWKDWIILNVIIYTVLRFLSVSISRINSRKRCR